MGAPDDVSLSVALVTDYSPAGTQQKKRLLSVYHDACFYYMKYL